MVKIKVNKSLKFCLSLILGFCLLLTGQPQLWQSPRIPPRVGKALAVSETRYMRSDQQTVNGLTAYQLGTSQSSSGLSTQVQQSGSGTLEVFWGIRVWKRGSGGSESEITSGTPVAQVSRTANGSGIQSTTWSCPQTVLATTDSVVVRAYIQVGTNGWLQGGTAPVFTTAQLGKTQLDGATWTVYYYTVRESLTTGSPSGRWTRGTFYWGTSTYDSRIANFSYQTPPSISITTDGTVAFGTMPANTTKDSTAGGVNDVQTVSVDTGSADLDIKSGTFFDGSNTWTLSTGSGANQVHFEFSKDGSNWTSFAASETYYAFDTNISQGDTRSIYLRLTVPTATSSYNQHSATITLLGSEP